MPQTVPPALTARCAHNGLDHNVRSKPLGRTFYCCSKLVIKLITYDKLQIFFSNNLYDTGGFYSALGRFGRWAKRSCKQAQGMSEVSAGYAQHSIKFFPCDTELPEARTASEAQSKS